MLTNLEWLYNWFYIAKMYDSLNLLNQSETKQKIIATWPHAYSQAWCWLYMFALSFIGSFFCLFDVNWLPASTSPYSYSRQPVLWFYYLYFP